MQEEYRLRLTPKHSISGLDSYFGNNEYREIEIEGQIYELRETTINEGMRLSTRGKIINIASDFVAKHPGKTLEICIE